MSGEFLNFILNLQDSLKMAMESGNTVESRTILTENNEAGTQEILYVGAFFDGTFRMIINTEKIEVG